MMRWKQDRKRDERTAFDEPDARSHLHSMASEPAEQGSTGCRSEKGRIVLGVAERRFMLSEACVLADGVRTRILAKEIAMPQGKSSRVYSFRIDMAGAEGWLICVRQGPGDQDMAGEGGCSKPSA